MIIDYRELTADERARPAHERTREARNLPKKEGKKEKRLALVATRCLGLAKLVVCVLDTPLPHGRSERSQIAPHAECARR